MFNTRSSWTSQGKKASKGHPSMASASAPASWPAWVPVLTSFCDELHFEGVSWINPFLPNLLLGHDVCAGIGTLTKTERVWNSKDHGESDEICIPEIYSKVNILFFLFLFVFFLCILGCPGWFPLEQFFRIKSTGRDQNYILNGQQLASLNVQQNAH